MPGRRLKNPYVGFRAEQLTIFALSAYASVVHIPIEEDYGNDLICTIIKEKGKFLIPSNPFFVQCKSNESNRKKVVVYGKEDEINWFLSINIPFYISLVYLKNNARIELYKTCEKIPLAYSRNCKKITLIRGSHKNGKTTWDSNGDIYMGKPVISIPIGNMNKKDPEITKTIGYWTALETQNYYWKNLGIKIYQRAVKYSTNYVPTELETKVFYGLGRSTQSQKEKAAIVLMHELFHEYLGEDGKSPKVKWDNLSQPKKEFYINSIKVLKQLSANIADNVKTIYRGRLGIAAF